MISPNAASRCLGGAVQAGGAPAALLQTRQQFAGDQLGAAGLPRFRARGGKRMDGERARRQVDRLLHPRVARFRQGRHRGAPHLVGSR